jgi:DNA sulfur modification protein DndB
MFSTTDNMLQKIDNQDYEQSLVTSELTEAIKQSIQPIMVEQYRKGQTFLAVGSQHGSRLMLLINAHANEIPTLLRSRSVTEDSNDPTSGKNRPINQSHVEKIKQYIVERSKAGNKWILGTITANVDPSKIKYQNIWGDLYVVVIYNSTSLEITDGQHRKKAIMELIESDKEGRDALNDATFPINLVLEADLQQCQTDFCDMAQTLSIPQSLLVAYSGFGKDAIAREVVEQVNMFRNKTQKIKATPGSKTGYIYTINYVAKLVSCAFAGNPTNKLDQINTNELVKEKAKELGDCLNYFFLAYSQTANIFEKDHHWQKIATLTGNIISQEKIPSKDADKFRDNCILGISIGLEILGNVLYYIHEKTGSFNENMTKQIAQEIDWSRKGLCWKDTVIVPDGKGSTKLSTGRGSVNTALKKCFEQLRWE